MRYTALLPVACLLLLCGAAPVPPGAQQIDLASARVVDLTHAFDKDTIYWPTSPSGFELKPLHQGLTGRGFYYSAYALCAPEHGGTHLDAPVHFAEGAWTNAEIPVDRFIRAAVVIDISEKAAKDPDYALGVDDVVAFEAKHGKIAAGTAVLLRTGWSKRWPDKRLYLGDDIPGDASNLHFPSYGLEAAKFLIRAHKQILVGNAPRAFINWVGKIFFFNKLVEAIANEKPQHVIENRLPAVKKAGGVAAPFEHTRQSGEVLSGLRTLHHTRAGQRRKRTHRRFQTLNRPLAGGVAALEKQTLCREPTGLPVTHLKRCWAPSR
jgi:kynurenine formamidase